MSREHDQLRQLVLALEDLNSQDRKAAEAHLATCDSCRLLRERLLAAEAAGRDADPLPLEEDPLISLTAVERVEARSSLSALVKARARRKTASFKWIVPMAMAAALVLFLLAPHLRSQSIVYDLRVGSPLVLRDVTDAPAGYKHGVSFRLRQPGHPLLIHVDGDGVGRLLYPLPGDLPRLQAVDQLVLLPPPSRGDEWRDDLAPGKETYLLTVSDPASPPGQDELHAISSPKPAGSREEAIRRLQKLLEPAGLVVVRLDADTD